MTKSYKYPIGKTGRKPIAPELKRVQCSWGTWPEFQAKNAREIFERELTRLILTFWQCDTLTIKEQKRTEKWPRRAAALELSRLQKLKFLGHSGLNSYFATATPEKGEFIAEIGHDMNLLAFGPWDHAVAPSLVPKDLVLEAPSIGATAKLKYVHRLIQLQFDTGANPTPKEY